MGTKKAPTQKTSSTTSKKAAASTPSTASTKTKTPSLKTPSLKTPSTPPMKTSTPTEALAARLARAPMAREVKMPEPTGIAVRVATKQLDLPLLVHVGDLVVFDLYPFRFVGVNEAKVDWPALLRLTRASHVQLGLDDDFEDDGVLVYSLSLPLSALDSDDTVQRAVGTLCGFAEDNYGAVLKATGLSELKNKR